MKRIVKIGFLIIVAISLFKIVQFCNQMSQMVITVDAKMYATGNGGTIEGDLNKNGKIDLQDIIILLRKYLGIDNNDEDELKAPVLSYNMVGVDGNNTINDVAIDYPSYRIGENNANILDGWELYVTSDNAPGNEMTIGGIGYFFHGNYTNEQIAVAMVDYGDTHRYVARVYKVVNNEKVYSDWSNVIEISAELRAPVLSYSMVQNAVAADADYTMNDIIINYSSYCIGENGAYILDGWELYVTSDNAPGNEMTIGGVGYFFHSDNKNQQIAIASVDYGDTHRYVARVYKVVNNERVYSDWSNVIEISAELKAPVLSYNMVGVDGNNTINDVAIDYPSYRIGENNANILDGWELYVTSDNAPGNEMTIGGIGYFFHGDYTNEQIAVAMVDYGDTHRYVARVYKTINNEKIYSDWSNVLEITPEQ